MTFFVLAFLNSRSFACIKSAKMVTRRASIDHFSFNHRSNIVIGLHNSMQLLAL